MKRAPSVWFLPATFLILLLRAENRQCMVCVLKKSHYLSLPIKVNFARAGLARWLRIKNIPTPLDFGKQKVFPTDEIALMCLNLEWDRWIDV